MATLANANSTMTDPATNGSPMPQPVTMHAPLASQRMASGIPISQNVHHRAIWPVANRARNFIDSRLAAAALFVTRRDYVQSLNHCPSHSRCHEQTGPYCGG